MRNIGRFSVGNSHDLYPHNYTKNHMVIFENQLQEPSLITLTNPNIENWVRKHKINHDNWRISDIDNYMKGKHNK